MLSYTDLRKGIVFEMDGAPYEVLESNFVRMQQRKAVVQTRVRNLITGKVLERNFQPSDSFEEAEVERSEAVFIYASRGEYWFHKPKDPGTRFQLSGDVFGEGGKFLKEKTIVTTLTFRGRVIGVRLPIKMDFEVIEAPPALKGATAAGGAKQVVIEGGATVNAPMFIEAGDIVKINTETGEYVERVEKG